MAGQDRTLDFRHRSVLLEETVEDMPVRCAGGLLPGISMELTRTGMRLRRREPGWPHLGIL